MALRVSFFPSYIPCLDPVWGGSSSRRIKAFTRQVPYNIMGEASRVTLADRLSEVLGRGAAPTSRSTPRRSLPAARTPPRKWEAVLASVARGNTTKLALSAVCRSPRMSSRGGDKRGGSGFGRANDVTLFAVVAQLNGSPGSRRVLFVVASSPIFAVTSVRVVIEDGSL